MSSLPIAEKCGKAPALASVSAGRSAAMSTAYHARNAGDPSAILMMARLSDEERAEVANWHPPPDVELDKEQGLYLRASEAIYEQEVAIDAQGNVVPAHHENALTVGHVDMHWLVRHQVSNDQGDIADRLVVYVVDEKRSEWTVTDGPASLQLHAYGMALALMYDADSYVCGIWAAVEGLWSWGEEVSVGSRRFLEVADRVIAAASNPGTEYATGPHCQGCWGRLHCPAYLVPPEVAHSSLAPFVLGAEITNEQATRLQALCKAARDTIDKVEDNLKEAVRRGQVKITDGNGKIWAPVEISGRVSLDKEALERDLGSLAKYERKGKPYQMFRWIKAAP